MSVARISHIEIQSGKEPKPSSVATGAVTLFIGPNGGGKSTALRDLNGFANFGVQRLGPPTKVRGPIATWPGGTVISAAQMGTATDLEEVEKFLGNRIIRRTPEHVEVRHIPLMGAAGHGGGIHVFAPGDLDPSETLGGEVAAQLLAISNVMLNGRERFGLALPGQLTELRGPATSHWMAIERDPEIYDAVDRTIFEAFQRHLVFQTFSPPTLVPALADEAMPRELRHSTATEAIEHQQRATPLSELSDGVQVFCGLVAALSVIPHSLILVDEPEAFLHPTLSRRLGAHLARMAQRRDARLFAATHSSSFLLGCLEVVPATTVMRLGYSKGVASSNVLEAQQVSRLARDPLMRSTSALDALFAKGAVVCEADADRAFYEEINRRLLADVEGGAPDIQFLNAQNWQTTVRLAKPLRSAGVPTAVILDLDTLAEDAHWADFVAMAAVTNERRDRILSARSQARDAIRACGRYGNGGPLKVKSEGLAPLGSHDRSKVEGAIRELALIGIFIVDVGELERWLLGLGCTNKQTWVTDMLGRLGTPHSPNYVAASEGDVWEFIGCVAAWLTDPNREGMPAG